MGNTIEQKCENCGLFDKENPIIEKGQLCTECARKLNSGPRDE